MMNQIQQFIDFVELDQRLEKLIANQGALREKETQLAHEIASIHQETETALDKVRKLRKEFDGIELELKSLADMLHVTTTKLSRASNPKEFFSLEHEVQELEKKKAPLEDQGLQILLALEKAQKDYDGIKAQESEKLDLLVNKREALEKDRVFGEDLLKAYKEQRQKEEKVLPAELINQYIQMKEKVKNPVVPLTRGSCSACFYAVSQPDIIEASHGKLVPCKDCYRLLYITQIGNHE